MSLGWNSRVWYRFGMQKFWRIWLWNGKCFFRHNPNLLPLLWPSANGEYGRFRSHAGFMITEDAIHVKLNTRPSLTHNHLKLNTDSFGTKNIQINPFWNMRPNPNPVCKFIKTKKIILYKLLFYTAWPPNIIGSANL